MLWLRALAMLLPAARRYEWLQEWHAELWCVRREGSWWDEVQYLRGAWADVLAVREIAGVRMAVSWRDVTSLRGLSMLVLGLAVLALSIPSSRVTLLAPAYTKRGVVRLHEGAAKVSGEEYAEWTRHMHRLRVQRTAFYSVSVRKVNGVPVRVAVATPELLQVLGWDSRAMAEGEIALTAGGAKRFRGQVVEVGGVLRAVASVMPETSLRLPGEPEVILFAANVPAGAHGYVLAEKVRVDASLRQGVSLRQGRRDVNISYEPLEKREVMPIRAFLFALVLALIALPASQPLSNRVAMLEQGVLPLSVRLRAMSFIGLQMALVAVASGLVAVMLASLTHRAEPSSESLLQAIITFVLALPMMRVMLHSHRHRCPHCLRTLGNAAQVGCPSTSFLDWYGTELVCAHGHGLVHVPDMPTTWFPGPKWVALDASWAGLFE